MASLNKRSLRSLTKSVTSEYFNNINKKKSQEISLRKSNLKINAVITPIKIEYEGHVSQNYKSPLPQSSVMPLHWNEIYENIKTMRANRDAAVDQMGAEKCCDKNTPPKVQRYHILIGLMLSSQTRDEVTHAAVNKLKEHGLTVENILNTSQDVIQELIYPVGFYKRKSEYILRTSQILKDKFDSDIPFTVKDLCSLPGVGRKMAYLCMDIAWNKMEGIGVDTHVHRISNRLGWTGAKGTKTPEETRKALEEWLPKELWREVNLLLVGFGQQICLPLYPRCSECLNNQICPYGSNSANRSPKKSPAKKKKTW